MLTDFVYHSTLGLRVINKEEKKKISVGNPPYLPTVLPTVGLSTSEAFTKSLCSPLWSLRLKDLQGPVTRVKKKKKKSPLCGQLPRAKKCGVWGYGQQTLPVS